MTEYSPHTDIAHKTGKPSTLPKTRIVLISIASVIGLGLSFLGGIQFQKGKNTVVNTTATQSQFGSMNGQMMGPGGNGVRIRGNIGEVTAISSTSITYKNRNDESKTFTINSDTKITKDGTTATIDDIAAGDTVLITEDSADTSIAARIAVNPTISNAPTDTQVNTN